MNHWPQVGIFIALAWLAPAAVLLWTLRTNHRGSPLRFKFGAAVCFSVMSVGTFGAIVCALWRMTRRIHVLDYAALSLWFCQAIIWLALSRYALLKLKGQSTPGFVPGKRNGAFFWQGLMILLPVGVMSVIGLFSLRQDRRMAEEDARETAAALAQQLAHSLGGELQLQWQSYRNANVMLQASRQAAVGLTDWRPGTDLARVKSEIEDWQQTHPQVDLAATPEAEFQTDTDGRNIWEYPLVPQPPAWLGELSAEQLRLWRRVQALEYEDDEAGTVQPAFDAFLATNPPKGAQANAQLILLRVRARHLPAEEAFQLFASSRLAYSSGLSEAGLPVRQLVCYEALRHASNQTALSSNLVRIAAADICQCTSILSPRLIEEWDRVTRSGSEPSAEVSVARGLWNAEEAARRLLVDFREQCSPASWSNGFCWANSGEGEYLLTLAKSDTVRITQSTPNGTTFVSNLPAMWWFHAVPKAVVMGALTTGLAKADLAIPRYARATMELGGLEFEAGYGTRLLKTSATEWPLLGSAVGAVEMTPNPTNVWQFPFRTRVYLAEPAFLYARQRQRSLLFGGLILASALAALAGFLAARRAFYRQLRLNDLKSDFVSSVSHELRAPIASVRLMAEGLERGNIAEPVKQREYFKFIVQECRRLSSLIENMLDFSRIEQGRKQCELEPTDLAALTQQTVKVMQTYAAERGVGLALRLGGEPAPVELDGKAMQQALVNLVDNALKHSPKGADVTVGLEFQGGPSNAEGGTPPTPDAADGAVRLWVEDRGEGIPASEHEKIFERFYRVGSELRRETQGVGIGLSIVKHIVEAHGGRVTVRSAPGQGSRFTIELPMDGRRRNERRAGELWRES